MKRTDQFMVDVVNLSQYPISGERLMRTLKAKGYNPWRASIDISRLVKSGILEITKGKADTAPGHTMRHVYRATERGLNAANVVSTRVEHPRIDLEPVVERAMESGKWTILPERVSNQAVAELRERGFLVRYFVKFEAEGNSGE